MQWQGCGGRQPPTAETRDPAKALVQGVHCALGSGVLLAARSLRAAGSRATDARLLAVLVLLAVLLLLAPAAGRASASPCRAPGRFPGLGDGPASRPSASPGRVCNHWFGGPAISMTHDGNSDGCGRLPTTRATIQALN